jgi:hypothetical protein
MAPNYHENFMGDTVFNFDFFKEKESNLFGIFGINFLAKNDLVLDLEKMRSKVKNFIKYDRSKN